MHSLSKQQGISLVISLIMLVVMTLMTISYVNSSTSTIRVVGNMQAQDEAMSAAQLVIENSLNSLNTFTAPALVSQNVDLDNDGIPDYAVVLQPPMCMSHTVKSGYGQSMAPPWDTYWNTDATVTDLRGSGATYTIHQGTRITLMAYQAPAGC